MRDELWTPGGNEVLTNRVLTPRRGHPKLIIEVAKEAPERIADRL